MLIRRPPDLQSSEVTPREIYVSRRHWMAGAAAMGLSMALPPGRAAATPLHAAPSLFSTEEKPTRSCPVGWCS